jgi:NAD(P)H dehydrogenase (quinone)
VLISIVYDCGFGHTARQAAAVAEGARTVAGATIHLLPVSNGHFDWKLLEERARPSSSDPPLTTVR